MSWYTLGGAFILLCGAFWLLKSYGPARSLPTRERVSALSFGIGLLVIGAGVMMIAMSEGKGQGSTIGVALIVGAVCMRAFVNLTHRGNQ